jgi:glutamate-1-semialdehyde 2,1-aminomutase
MAASIATMHVYRTEPVIEHLVRQGKALQSGIDGLIAAHGLQDFFSVVGHPACLSFTTRDDDGKPSQAFRTLFLQEIIRRGILAPSLVVSYTHSDEDIVRTIDAFDGALRVYKLALENGIGKYLVGRPSQIVFRRFNNPPPSEQRPIARLA